MENKNGSLSQAIAGALGLGVSPREALQRIAGQGVGNSGQNHTGRDVSTLRRLGLQPVKVCGRWVVPPGELARWAAGQAAPQEPDGPAAPANRRPGRPRKSCGRLDVQMKNGGAL